MITSSLLFKKREKYSGNSKGKLFKKNATDCHQDEFSAQDRPCRWVQTQDLKRTGESGKRGVARCPPTDRLASSSPARLPPPPPIPPPPPPPLHDRILISIGSRRGVAASLRDLLRLGSPSRSLVLYTAIPFSPHTKAGSTIEIPIKLREMAKKPLPILGGIIEPVPVNK
ncbi:unnamed protein product, partial [Nesidiocoris tenuis]